MSNMTASVAVGTTTSFGKERNLEMQVDRTVKVTVREFARAIPADLSPSMREIQIGLAVERLMEERGIELDPSEFKRLAR